MSYGGLANIQVDRRLLRQALALLLFFLVWTVVVWTGVSDGNRTTAWRPQTFGAWPARFGAVDGTYNAHLSIYASAQAPPADSQSPTEGSFFGNAVIGAADDSYDSNMINGSRFVTGEGLTAVSSVSVFIPGPIDEAPHNQYQIAIYKDGRGAPAELLAQTGIGTLTPKSWNTLAIRAEVQPETAYWLMYNTNGSTGAVNNMAYTTDPGSLDGAIRDYRNAQIETVGHAFEILGNFMPMTIAVVILAVWLGRRNPGITLSILALYAVGLLVVLALKTALLSPFGEYPSGHSMRIIFVAFLLVYAFPTRLTYLVAATLVALEGLSVIYMGGHYVDEVLGGLVLGAAAAIAARAITLGPIRLRT